MSSSPLPRNVVIKALIDFVCLDDVEQHHCPVQALHFYLDWLKDVSPRPRSLFVSPSKPSRPISKDILSVFLCESISGSGAGLGPAGDSSAPRVLNICGGSLCLLTL